MCDCDESTVREYRKLSVKELEVPKVKELDLRWEAKQARLRPLVCGRQERRSSRGYVEGYWEGRA